MSPRTHARCITPPYLLEHLLTSSDPEVRAAAARTLAGSVELRVRREVTTTLAPEAVVPQAAESAGGARSIYDAQHQESTSGPLVRGEDGPAVDDASVNQAFDGLGVTRQFYADVLGRDSIDGNGGALDGYVHYGRAFNNAFWDGSQMVFGDGDGQIFADFTGSLDVIGHELTHGVTEALAGLEYHLQPGALNESISDVFGSLVKQFSRNQTADEADWLIGDDIFTPDFAGDALRSLKAPGTAYDNATFGKDEQPAHMDDFVVLPDTAAGDWGGVHTNSGIPNHAFYLVATAIGGYAWEAAGHIWFEALAASTPKTDFTQFARNTLTRATLVFGESSSQAQAVRDGWSQVGIALDEASTED